MIKSNLIKFKDLSPAFLIFAFSVKVVSGICYGWIHKTYFNGVDTFSFFKDSLQIGTTFFQAPDYYLYHWMGFTPEIPKGIPVFIYPETNYIVKDFGSYFLVHLHALPVVLSAGIYNVHIIFIAFIALIASINTYRALKDILQLPNVVLIFVCFFMPSVLFWTSGFHKDVWLFLGLSLILLGLRFGKLSKPALVKIAGGLLLFVLFKYYLLVVVLPSLFAYIWSLKQDQLSAGVKFMIVHMGVLGIIFLLEFTGVFSVTQILSLRQHEFLSEIGSSNIPSLEPWEPNFWGMLCYIPSAIVNVAFRPFFWDCKDGLQLMAATEIFVFWLIVFFIIIFKNPAQSEQPVGFFLIFFSLSNLILVGLLVGNVGTIVRYRAIALGCLAIIILQIVGIVKKKLKPNNLI